MTPAICTNFALELLAALADYDLTKVKSLFHEVGDESSLELQFPPPQGFRYRAGVNADTLVSHLNEQGDGEVLFDFQMPFEEEDFEPMMIRTIFRGDPENYTVTLAGVVPG